MLSMCCPQTGVSNYLNDFLYFMSVGRMDTCRVVAVSDLVSIQSHVVSLTTHSLVSR